MTDTHLEIRPAQHSDFSTIWRIMQPVIQAGETYALPRDMKETDARAYWYAPQHEVFVAKVGDEVVGTYFLQPNQRGGGGHVANCGYMTAPWAMGRGVAKAMCAHSLNHARERGFHAMQFNFVISTNERAVKLWQSFEFEIAGRLPRAFKHPYLGFVDALIMYRKL
jgi:L-amino acid N-acyltransferase YncA